MKLSEKKAAKELANQMYHEFLKQVIDAVNPPRWQTKKNS
jgi:hypothetical protein